MKIQFQNVRSYFFIKKKNLALICMLLLAVGAAYYFLQREEVVPPAEPIVVVQPVKRSDVEVYGEYVGRVKAQQHVEVHARVEGFLEKMLFEEGTHVEKGQTLFVIDQRQYKARADRARAQLAKDEALMRKAEHDLNRIRPLYEQNAASRLDLDNAVAAFEGAKAAVGMSRADLEQALMELSYTVVRAPIAGSIGERLSDLGALVGGSGRTKLATVMKCDTVTVLFSLTALDFLKCKERNVNLGQRVENRSWQPFVTVTLADNSRYPHKGLVDFADPQVDPRTGTFAVRAELPNPEGVLLPGQFTKVRLLLDVRTNALTVPVKALIVEKGGAYIFVVRADGTAEKRFVELGPQQQNSVVVERGLAQGEKVVVEGQHKLTAGQKVKISEVKRAK